MEAVPVNQKKVKNNAGCLVIALLVTVLSVASGFIFGTPAPNAADDFDACYMAQRFVKDELRAPSTATFAPCSKPDTVAVKIGHKWTVRSWVDAQNGFGAMLRNDYTVEMIYYPSADKWTLVDLALNGR